MILANESYFMIENEIKKINLIIEKLKFERDNLDSNLFSYNNYLINKNFDEIFNLETNVNSKRRAKGKKLINNTEILSNSTNKKIKKKLKGKKLLRDNSKSKNDKNNNDNNSDVVNEEKKKQFWKIMI